MVSVWTKGVTMGVGASIEDDLFGSVLLRIDDDRAQEVGRHLGGTAEREVDDDESPKAVCSLLKAQFFEVFRTELNGIIRLEEKGIGQDKSKGSFIHRLKPDKGGTFSMFHEDEASCLREPGKP